MAAVNLTFQGMFYDKVSRTYYENATMVGVAFITDLHVGGGPVIPPSQPPGGGGGGSPGVPTFPIWGPPGTVFPPGPGYPPVAGHPLPEPPDKPPEPIQPPIDWKVIWTPTEGWVVVGIPNVPHPSPA